MRERVREWEYWEQQVEDPHLDSRETSELAEAWINAGKECHGECNDILQYRRWEEEPLRCRNAFPGWGVCVWRWYWYRHLRVVCRGMGGGEGGIGAVLSYNPFLRL